MFFRALLGLDILCILFYVSITITVYATPGTSFNTRGAIFRLGTHIATTLSLIYIIYQRRQYLHPLALVFAFESFRDVINTIEIGVFSNLNGGLYVAGLVCGCLQSLVSVCALLKILLF
jgi:hypothetical protein